MFKNWLKMKVKCQHQDLWRSTVEKWTIKSLLLYSRQNSNKTDSNSIECSDRTLRTFKPSIVCSIDVIKISRRQFHNQQELDSKYFVLQFYEEGDDNFWPKFSFLFEFCCKIKVSQHKSIKKKNSTPKVPTSHESSNRTDNWMKNE